MRNFVQTFHYLILEPLKQKRLALIVLRTAQLLHDKTQSRSDIWFQRLGKIIKPKVQLPISLIMNESAIATITSSLLQHGSNILPFRLSAEDIASLKKFAFSVPAYTKDPSEKINISEANIPNEFPRYEWQIPDLFRLPVVQKLIKDGPFHKIAQAYIGSRPTMTSVSLWLDTIYTKKYAAHVYHHDNDGPAFLKFFIYLTNVDLESGAHMYIDGSQGPGKPPHLSQSRRYERSELIDYYGEEKEIIFAAPAGTVIAEDTSGFHKGTTPTKSYRLLLQIQYAMYDIPHIGEDSPVFEKVHIEGLPSSIQKICHKFVK